MIKAIVAVDTRWGIGKNNDLLFSIPKDMEFFRKTTAGGVVMMGFNTLLSLPNSMPLKNRTNIVLCPEGTEIHGAIAVYNLDQLFNEISKIEGDVFVIGGAMFYKTMLPYCSELLVTKVDEDGFATVYFDNLDNDDNFEMIEQSNVIESNGYEFKFTKYINKNVQTYGSKVTN